MFSISYSLSRAFSSGKVSDDEFMCIVYCTLCKTVYYHFHVAHQQKQASSAAIFIGKGDTGHAHVILCHSVYKEANVHSACVTSLKWLEKTTEKNAVIGQRPKATFNLHGLVKLQVSCSFKCKIIMLQQGTPFSLMPFGQLKRFACCPVFRSEIMSYMHRAMAEKSRGSLLKNYKLKKKNDSCLVPGDLLPSWNQHPLTSRQAKAGCVVC